MIEPPFVRAWTLRAGQQAAVVSVQNGLIIYRCETGVGAVELATGAQTWTAIPTVWVNAAAAFGNRVYAMARGDKDSTLWELDAATGKARSFARVAGDLDQVTVDAGRVYVGDATGTVRALDRRTGEEVWTCKLPQKGARRVRIGQLAVTSAGLFAGADDAGEFGIDANKGTILWNHPSQYGGLYPPIVVGADVITQTDAVKRTNVRTGKPVWTAGKEEGAPVVFSKILVTCDQVNLIGRSLADGHVLWKLPVHDRGYAYGGTEEPRTVSDENCVWIERRPVMCVSKDGRELWSRPEAYTGSAVYADSQRVITVDGHRFLGYKPGVLPPLPAGEVARKELAERLASQFDMLDRAERQRLASLTPYSFAPLLKRYVGWAREYAARLESHNTYDLYDLLTTVRPLMLATCRKEDTPAIVEALGSLGEKSNWRSDLERILQQKGDPAGYIPVLVKSLRAAAGKNARRETAAALEAVSHSSHPDAVALMLEALRDPKADPAWRQEAFRHLAGTGGVEGVAAVRATRKQRTTLKPWYERVSPAQTAPRSILATATDAKGRTWALFHSSVLGNYSDLFIAEKQEAGWGRPIFTGVWTDRTFNHEPPKEFRGIPIAKLVATEWIKIFPDDQAIRKDTDGDGLTDIVEARLGTDPTKADTDGDGVPDAVDPCPNAAPRVLGDNEKIVAASIEARFFGEAWSTPAILGVEGVKPFELYGYPQAVIWYSGTGETALNKMYGGGVNTIGFHSPDERSRDAKAFIKFSPDRKTARTIISRYSGGLNGDGTEVVLKKIGDEWFVVDMIGRYVS